jgi:AraC-like DNA-binding protein
MYNDTMTVEIPAVRAINGAFTICSPEWSWSSIHPPLGWEGYILWNVLSGEAEMTSPGGPLVARRGQVLLLHVGREDYEGWTIKPVEMALQWVHFVFETATDLRLKRSYEIDDPDFWEQTIARIIRRLVRGDDPNPTANAWLRAALSELTETDPPRRPPRSKQSANQAAIQQLCQEIEQRPSHRWTLAEMARRARLSRTHLSRLFKRHRRCTPTEFVIATRVRLAEHHLRLSNDPLASIAERLGYCDQFAFSKQFKQITGRSPSDYRRGG